MRVPGYGPAQADIVIVGEAPGYEEELEGRPFVGSSGNILSQVLREAGIQRAKCYITNVCKERPPNNDMSKWLTDKKVLGKKMGWPYRDGRYMAPPVESGLDDLCYEIAARKPKIVVALGNVALWALTGQWGIMDWRGSEMRTQLEGMLPEGCLLLPTLHPAGMLRSYATRRMLLHDLTFRVARRLHNPMAEPAWHFQIAPSFEEAMGFLRNLPSSIAVDIETSQQHIVCVGIATSPVDAMCIPFISEGYGAYWSAFNQKLVVEALREALITRSINGQNFNYDATYLQDDFGILTRTGFDTKIAQNVLWPGTPANLGYLSSIYCDWHCYWKDDNRDWENLKDFESLFRYNCRDACHTFEIARAQQKQLEAAHLLPQFQERMGYSHYVFDMQQRGLIRDPAMTAQLEEEINEMLQQRELIIADAAGHPLNMASPLQVSRLLYGELKCRKPASTGGGTDDAALKQVIKWHPAQAALCAAIMEWRSLASMRNNFLHAKLDPDGKLRSSFLTTGTETFRLTSSKNNYRRGTNLLNISGSGVTHSGTKTPNFRRIIVPPAGYTMFDCDLQRADLQVVVWEADDADLKEKLRAGVDIHAENAKDLFGTSDITKEQREKGKKFVHLTNYGGKSLTCAIECGTTVHEADMGQRRWFAAHPGIETWHNRTQEQLQYNRTITNAFGYRIVFMERINNVMLRDALAWKPQSTIAILASLIHMAAEDACGHLGLQVLVQMYDSIMGIYPTVREDAILPLLHEATRIAVPYPDPLYIDMGLKTSTVSWGDCETRSWP